MFDNVLNTLLRSSPPEVFLRKGVLKICSKFTGEHPCRIVISIKFLSALLKSYFGMSVLLWICCIFSEQLFLTTPLKDCFWLLLCPEHFFLIYKHEHSITENCIRKRKYCRNLSTINLRIWNEFSGEYFGKSIRPLRKSHWESHREKFFFNQLKVYQSDK